MKTTLIIKMLTILICLHYKGLVTVINNMNGTIHISEIEINTPDK